MLLEVEALAFCCHDPGVFVVDIVDFSFEGLFPFDGCEVIGELLGVSHGLDFLIGVPGLVSLVEEIFIIGVDLPDAVVHQEFQGEDGGDGGSVGGRSDF